MEKIIKRLCAFSSGLTASYLTSLFTELGSYSSIFGHILMGPLSVEIGSIIHKYIKKGKEIYYEIGSMVALNSLFQVLKYLNLMPLPGVGNNFEYGIFGGSIYLAYKHDRNISNTPRSNSI